VKFTRHNLDIGDPRLMARCSSFPPYTWELLERFYPNKLIAASQDEAAIHGAVWLYQQGMNR